jgi:hypothetical protein
MRARKLLAAVAALFCPLLASAAAITVNPLSTFGSNGWIAPGGAYPYLGTANNERGIAYNPTNNHLYLVSRTGGTFVRILDGTTGTDLGALNVGGVSGGTFAVDMVGVGGDGAVYVGNLTTASNTTAFTVYKWANEAAAPTTAYSGNAGLSGARIGDSLAVTGSGSSTRIVSGYGSSPSVAGNNGYAIIDPTAGTATAVGFPATPPNAGDFRLAVTFADGSHVLGTQTGGSYRSTSFTGTSGTLLGTATLTGPSGGTTAERLLAYQVVGGVPLLAVQSTGDAHVSIYDVTDPNNPQYLGGGLNIPGGATASNGNGTGELAWSPDVGGTATLYAMSTNAGIQAFTVSVAVPEPATVVLLGLAAPLLLVRRRLSALG